VSANGSPVLAVVMVADRYDTLARVVRSFAKQERANDLEMLVVLPTEELDGVPAGAGRTFGDFRPIGWDGDVQTDLPRARAEAVHQAEASLVVLAETHAFPQPGWCDAVLDAHATGADVVGPAMFNGNPQSMVSWANLFMDYGPWIEAKAREPVADVPGHNSSYRRELLTGYGSELGEMMRSHSILNGDLHSRGLSFIVEPRARIAHVNVSRLRPWLEERFVVGMVFADLRSREWPLWRRAVYAAAFPLIPLVRLRRILLSVRRSGLERDVIPAMLPALLVGLAVATVGEVCGFSVGSWDGERRLSGMEINRFEHVRSDEVPASSADGLAS
jgi:hypothetical protein